MILKSIIIDNYLKRDNEDFSEFLSSIGYEGLCTIRVEKLLKSSDELINNTKLVELLNNPNLMCSLQGNKSNYIPFRVKAKYKRKWFKTVFSGYEFLINDSVSLISDLYNFGIFINE